MTPERRLEALGRAPHEHLEQLADRILARDPHVVVLAGPEVATAAVRLSVPGTEATFVCGRAVLSTCAVALDGVRGDGVVQGRVLPAALAAAVCDAEAERDGALAEAVAELADAALERTGRERAAEAARVAATRIVEPAEADSSGSPLELPLTEMDQ